jgi:hypothetical protein
MPMFFLYTNSLFGSQSCFFNFQVKFSIEKCDSPTMDKLNELIKIFILDVD